MSAPKSPVQKALEKRSLWPLYGILLIGLLLVVGRGCGTDESGPAADATTTVTKTVTAGSHASGGSTRGGGLFPDSTTSPARGPAGSPASSGPRSLAWCSLDHLPPEAGQTANLIEAGGPFPYPRNDGVTFRNAEHVLPAQATGYYREYTVPTPGSSDRGTRRIITGGNPATHPPQWYYTDDHYQTFCQITDAP